MTIIEKIKQSVEGATGMPFLYHAAGELNELIARCKELPVAYSFLIDSGTIDDLNGRYNERVTLAVMFCDKTDFDFNALENEKIIDKMKAKAYKWMQSLRMDNALRVISVNNTQRLYDNTTDILTGFAVNITIEDVAGVGECEFPEVVIDVEKNGSYNVVGVDKVRVNVVPRLEELEVTQNGEYIPPTDIAGFSKVKVNVQPTLEELTITANGEYLPQEGVDGFSKVVANVVPTKRVVISNIRLTNTQIIDGYWAGELVDTSTITSMENMFNGCRNLQSLDVSNWDTSNVTNMQSVFRFCQNLKELDVSNWNVDNIIAFTYMFENCTSLQSLDVSNWNVSNVTNMGNMFTNCTSLQSLDVSNWDVSNVTSIWNMFYGCTSLQSLDVSNWDTRNLKHIYNTFNNCISLQMLDVSKWDASKIETILTPFNNCTSLKSIIGNKSINDVLENNIGALNGLKISVNPFPRVNNIDRASLRALINGLADLTGQTAQTLTLGATLMAKLTEEDIAIATAKNWTIV